MGAYSPRSTDAIMLEMSEMRSVAAYAARVAGDPAILAIWLPVKRSYARLPVIAASASGPPTAFSAGAGITEGCGSAGTKVGGVRETTAQPHGLPLLFDSVLHRTLRG